MPTTPAKPSKALSSLNDLSQASFKLKPSVTRVTIFVARPPLTISSPTPVHEIQAKELAKFPAAVAESLALHRISKPLPPVDVAAAKFPCASNATQPTVPF